METKKLMETTHGELIAYAREGWTIKDCEGDVWCVEGTDLTLWDDVPGMRFVYAPVTLTRPASVASSTKTPAESRTLHEASKSPPTTKEKKMRKVKREEADRIVLAGGEVSTGTCRYRMTDGVLEVNVWPTDTGWALSSSVSLTHGYGKGRIFSVEREPPAPVEPEAPKTYAGAALRRELRRGAVMAQVGTLGDTPFLLRERNGVLECSQYYEWEPLEFEPTSEYVIHEEPETIHDRATLERRLREGAIVTTSASNDYRNRFRLSGDVVQIQRVEGAYVDTFELGFFSVTYPVFVVGSAAPEPPAPDDPDYAYDTSASVEAVLDALDAIERAR